MAGAPPRLLALDTNLVLDLAEGLDAAHDFRETFKDRGYAFRLRRRQQWSFGGKA